ncbi:glycine--tRNA ligase [Candidatus Bathyarchaeota archaeon]|nr:MAG: glycine--tRNA ligase [Candidatus Bathyarchaeota archaeon]TMI31039.1 MAG: glycine--tRNA ligase [Candidatus Bathyarchaeota archaeon]
MIYDKAKLLSEVARRRGFFWSSFEIYGGMSGFLDLGPLGVGLKRLITDSWRSLFLHPHGFVEVSTPIITPYKLLEASGHVENFKDPITECTQCHRRFRADHLVKEQTGTETEGLSLEQLGELMRSKGVKCPECGGVLGAPQYFMTMFKTSVGPFGEDPAYGRPEAAQGIFVNFRRISEVMRERFPLGVAQVGTVLRNEISPRQGPIRLREFTIMDFELFFNPEEPECPFLSEAQEEILSIVTAKTREQGKEEVTKVRVSQAIREEVISTPWMAYFMSLSKQFLASLGISEAHQRFFEKLPSERAHYSAQTFDHEIQLDRYGWVEVAGFAYRSDYDLRRHMEATGTDMRIFHQFDKPVERTVVVVKPRPDKIRGAFGGNTGKILALLASRDLPSLIHSAQKSKMVKIEQYEVPLDFFDVHSDKVKEAGSRFIPHVVEPSFGVERLVYAALEYGLQMKEDRLILSLPFRLAPVQVSVLPLVNRDELQERATAIFTMLLRHGFRAEYDEAGSIGRRYARADEAGVPIGVTVDYDTLKDGSVTLRDRDSWAQVRAPVDSLAATIGKIVSEGFPKSRSSTLYSG